MDVAAPPAAPTTSTIHPRSTESGVVVVLKLPAVRGLLVSGLFFSTAFLWMQFLAAYIVQHATGSARLVQLAGLPRCLIRPQSAGACATSVA